MYEDRFISFSEKVEKWIKFFLILFFFFLFVLQGLLQYEPFRYFFSPVDQMEGHLLDINPSEIIPSWMEGRPLNGN
jgi:hypothetical protein